MCPGRTWVPNGLGGARRAWHPEAPSVLCFGEKCPVLPAAGAGAVPPGAQGAEGAGAGPWEELGGGSQAGSSWHGRPWLHSPMGTEDGRPRRTGRGMATRGCWCAGSSSRNWGGGGCWPPRVPPPAGRAPSAGPGPRSGVSSRVSGWLWPREGRRPSREVPSSGDGRASPAWPWVRLFDFRLVFPSIHRWGRGRWGPAPRPARPRPPAGRSPAWPATSPSAAWSPPRTWALRPAAPGLAGCSGCR